MVIAEDKTSEKPPETGNLELDLWKSEGDPTPPEVLGEKARFSTDSQPMSAQVLWPCLASLSASISIGGARPREVHVEHSRENQPSQGDGNVS